MPSPHIVLACRPAQLRRFGMSTGTGVILACRRAHFGMSTAAVMSFLARRRAQASFWHVDGQILACPRPQLRLFWPVDGHTSFWHVDGRILACRRAHLLFYTLLFFLSSLLFGIAGRHFDMSTSAFWHVDGRIYYFTLDYFSFQRAIILACRRAHFACQRAHLLFYTLPFFLSSLLFGITGPSFWHVDGRILHVDGHIYYFTLDYFSFPAYFLASRARHFGTSTGAFCMSTGTSTILHFTVFPFQVC